MLRLSWLLLVGLASTVGGCGGDDQPPGGDGDADADADGDSDADTDADADGDADQSDALFDPDRILEVEIELAPDDWSAVRLQTRNLVQLLGGDCMQEPFGSPFTYFPGAVTVDGQRLDGVGVRKKGFLGSLDSVKPSLKVKFDEYEPGRELLDQDGLTLNNSRQDPSFLHQCMSYAFFADAGVPAPRCNYAHVTVNGEDLGLYVHVERVGKDMLRRSFADVGGNLYEGTLSDFRSGWTGTFELKTNELQADRTDLERVVTALQAPDEQLAASLDAVIDLDGFVTFWSAEVLLNHWDGYAGNTNNFFVYDDPVTGRFHFIPWGADGTMVLVAPPIGGGAPGTPTSVLANAAIAQRLYGHLATRDRYVARLRELIEAVWDEAAMLTEIDRMETLVEPLADPAGTGGFTQSVEDLRSFVRERPGQVLEELDAGPPSWDQPLRDPLCFAAIGHVTGDFDTTWGTIEEPNVFASGTGTLDAVLGEVPVQVTMTGSKAGWDPQAAPADPRAQVQVISALPDGNFGGLVINVRPEHFEPGAALPVDWDIVFGLAFHYAPATGAFTILAAMGEGTVQLEAASTQDAEAVVGSFDSELWVWPF